MALIWDKDVIRDTLNLFGGKIKNIITKGGTVYEGPAEPNAVGPTSDTQSTSGS